MIKTKNRNMPPWEGRPGHCLAAGLYSLAWLQATIHATAAHVALCRALPAPKKAKCRYWNSSALESAMESG